MMRLTLLLLPLISSGAFLAACGTEPRSAQSAEVPTLEIVGPTEVKEGTTAIWTVFAVAAEGDAARLEVSGSLAGRDAAALFIESAPGAAMLTFEAAAGDRLEGPSQLTFSAISSRDRSLRASEVVEVRIVNRPPTIARVGAQSVAPGQTLTFAIAASDPDGIPPRLACETMPPTGVCDLAAGHFSWTPPPDTERGPHRLTLVAQDSVDASLVSHERIEITVAADAPRLGPIADQAIAEGELLTLAVEAQGARDEAVILSAMIFDAPLIADLEAHGTRHSYSRASAATYHDAQGKLVHVPPDTPRFLPGQRGLLIEGRRVNLIPKSIALGAAPWVGNFEGSAIDDHGLAPDGTQTSSLVVGSTSPYASRSVPVSLTPHTHYETPRGMFTLKLYIKAGSSPLSRVGVYNTTRSAWQTFVELRWSEGAPSTAQLDNAAHVDLEETGYGGWWRLSFRFESDPATETEVTAVHVEPDRSGGGGSVEVWGCQLEAGHLSTSYIHNTTGAPLAREADLFSYRIADYALGFPENNVMVEWDYTPRWQANEVRGWHPRFWGSAVDGQTYFLARTSRSSPNFVATRTNVGDALQEDVTYGPVFDKGDLVTVIVRATSRAGLEILPNYLSDGVRYPEHRQRQAWGETLMVGNLTDHAVSNMAATETDGPLNAALRRLRVHLIDSDEPNASGASLVNGVFSWRPGAGAHRDSPYRVTFRATDPTDAGLFVQQTIAIVVDPAAP